MRSSGIRRRLEALEAHRAPASRDFPDWPIEDQFDDVVDALRVHKAGGTAQLATDRQIHLMGLLCARDNLPGGFGEHRFPSGAVIVWIDNEDGTVDVGASGYVRVEDLPDGVREYWERMDPDEQPDRERWLYEGRHAAKDRREKARGYEERVRAFEEKSRQRDRELLERNRAACGLPPLTSEQLSRWGLEGTRGEGVR